MVCLKGQNCHFITEPDYQLSSVATKFLKYNELLNIYMQISKMVFIHSQMHQGGLEVDLHETDLDFLSIGTALTQQKHTQVKRVWVSFQLDSTK